MWLLIAEMVLALSLIVFIMVWTLRARVDHQADETEAAEKPETGFESQSEPESTQANKNSEKD